MVLIVDDDARFLATARDTLSTDNQIFLAADATRALKLVENYHFSVVLIDLELGGDNGFLSSRSCTSDSRTCQ